MEINKDRNFAEVISVYPNKVVISVDDIKKFKETTDEAIKDLKVGSYIEISDDNNSKLIAIIESYKIEAGNGENKKFIIEANPLGTIIDDKFTRGGDSLTIPPTGAKPASHEDIEKIYKSSIDENEKFCFSKLVQDRKIEAPVNGNKFFNKHFAIVGATGSGKSHTVAKILQNAIESKAGNYTGLNNSHIVLFDIHNEYKTAFPSANFIDIENLILPYWLLNSEELEELFLDTEANDHNQRSVFQEAITRNKKINFTGEDDVKDKIHYDSPLKFSIIEVLTYIKNRNNEKQTSNVIKWKKKDGQVFEFNDDNADLLFDDKLESAGSAATGTLNGRFNNFINRLELKINDKRLDFILGQDKLKSIGFEDVLKNLIGYNENGSNITIIDLGGIPFEVLSITVSLISRLLFDYGYFFKKHLDKNRKSCETPLLLVFEEAHKYVPKSDLSKYRASRNAIERIAKEGRKYGVTLGILSQRPSEISETIFSQCNSFVVMRLTNPEDQFYVKRLLPDTLGNLTDSLPSLQSGEALLIGESIIIPSLVKIDECDADKRPSSNDIKYIEVWKEQWKEVDFNKIIEEW